MVSSLPKICLQHSHSFPKSKHYISIASVWMLILRALTYTKDHHNLLPNLTTLTLHPYDNDVISPKELRAMILSRWWSDVDSELNHGGVDIDSLPPFNCNVEIAPVGFQRSSASALFSLTLQNCVARDDKLFAEELTAALSLLSEIKALHMDRFGLDVDLLLEALTYTKEHHDLLLKLTTLTFHPSTTTVQVLVFPRS
ncbi:hypothetical protein BT96DRAFT_1022947 [Gymnopus androsaceus JB14]|uniref:Uncharacterized protein n=1 Tax=Gymnopus androsaceus JB14 TaxID=1447944 RepID=A0A6A4H778_9AGAR|nr:hypothetical protein BT96DRAFT_1022947 [Gymnopus androsaceus JB14]